MTVHGSQKKYLISFSYVMDQVALCDFKRINCENFSFVVVDPGARVFYIIVNTNLYHLKKQVMPSANNVNLISSLTITPCMLSSCLIWVASISIARINNKSDNGLPCRTPHRTWKRSVVNPFFKTQLDMFV